MLEWAYLVGEVCHCGADFEVSCAQDTAPALTSTGSCTHVAHCWKTLLLEVVIHRKLSKLSVIWRTPSAQDCLPTLSEVSLDAYA